MSDERRIRRHCLIALAVLLPAALWIDASEDITRVWRAYATEAIQVTPRQTTSFAGLNWRWLSHDTVWPTSQKPSETAEVAVRVEVDLTSAQAVKSLHECEAYLEDSSGQRWSPLPARYRETSCSRLSQASANDKRAVIIERFVVPTARASDVSLAIVMPSERPRYLRFPRPAP